MNIPPIWKIKREIRRIRNKVKPHFSWFFEISARRQYANWQRNLPQPLVGQIELRKKIAIFVLYQPKKIKKSIFLTCDHLVNNGYSPFIVSNSLIAESEKTLLLRTSTFLVERPNYGYDFGAYQDGIRLMGDKVHRIDRLILMNDSTWFPLRANDSSIIRMELSDDAFTGHVFKEEPNIRRGRDHIESHLLMFDNIALKSEYFTNFWRNYSMSSDRVHTIENGEKGISAAMSASGFQLRALASRKIFLSLLETATFSTVKKILKEAAFSPVNLNDSIPKLLESAADTPEWRSQVSRHLSDLLVRLAPVISTTFIYAALTELNLGFVKKSSDECFHLTRQKVLELAAAGEIQPLHRDVHDEMLASVKNWRRF